MSIFGANYNQIMYFVEGVRMVILWSPFSGCKYQEACIIYKVVLEWLFCGRHV